MTSHMVNLPRGWYPHTRSFFATLTILINHINLSCTRDWLLLRLSHNLIFFRIKIWPHTVRPTHTGRHSAMRRDSLVFKSRQICSLDSFIENSITFQLLQSATFHIYQSFLFWIDLFPFIKGKIAPRCWIASSVCRPIHITYYPVDILFCIDQSHVLLCILLASFCRSMCRPRYETNKWIIWTVSCKMSEHWFIRVTSVMLTIITNNCIVWTSIRLESYSIRKV